MWKFSTLIRKNNNKNKKKKQSWAATLIGWYRIRNSFLTVHVLRQLYFPGSFGKNLQFRLIDHSCQTNNCFHPVNGIINI